MKKNILIITSVLATLVYGGGALGNASITSSGGKITITTSRTDREEGRDHELWEIEDIKSEKQNTGKGKCQPGYHWSKSKVCVIN
jgi:hypothetical protein